MVPVFTAWIGEGPADPALLAHVAHHVEVAFGATVHPWTPPGPPRNAFDPRRRQHASGAILKWLLEVGPAPGPAHAKVLAITDRDLFIPILTYVFGEAQLSGAAAVVSTARLREDIELFGPRLLLERLAKEAVHELGHTFGLRHCGTPACVMGRSAGVRDVDEKGPLPCAECRERLRQQREGA
jgi:archaemetzincin